MHLLQRRRLSKANPKITPSVGLLLSFELLSPAYSIWRIVDEPLLLDYNHPPSTTLFTVINVCYTICGIPMVFIIYKHSGCVATLLIITIDMHVDMSKTHNGCMVYIN
jgi:hypothetical protein